MQATATRTQSYLYEVTIKESGTEFEKARTKAIEDIRKKGSVKGFKKGSNIPDAIIIREYGEANITERAIDALMNKLYLKAIAKAGITPVAPGQIQNIVSTSPFEVVISVEVLPEFEIDEAKIDTISTPRTTVSVEDAEVDAAIDEIRTKFTHFHHAGAHTEDGADTSHVAIETGDRVTISAQGHTEKGGEAIPETRVPNYPLVIGSGTFIPGFEKELIGAKQGDTVEFDITFPADYHSDEFKNRVVHFVVEVEGVEKPHIPEFTEDFIESLRGHRTDLAGLREIIRKEIIDKKEQEARAKDEDILMKQFLEVVTIEAGPAMIAGEIDRVYAEQSSRLEQQGFNMKDYLAHVKKGVEEYKEEIVKPEAMRRLQAELLLRKLRELKKVEASDEEVNMEVETMIALYSTPEVVDRLRAKLVPGDGYYEEIRSRLAYKKTVDLFLK